jgi:hypothetical protein
MQAFKTGMDLLDVGNGQQARVYFSKAIELDSNFATALSLSREHEPIK